MKIRDRPQRSTDPLIGEKVDADLKIARSNTAHGPIPTHLLIVPDVDPSSQGAWRADHARAVIDSSFGWAVLIDSHGGQGCE